MWRNGKNSWWALFSYLPLFTWGIIQLLEWRCWSTEVLISAAVFLFDFSQCCTVWILQNLIKFLYPWQRPVCIMCTSEPEMAYLTPVLKWVRTYNSSTSTAGDCTASGQFQCSSAVCLLIFSAISFTCCTTCMCYCCSVSSLFFG